MRNRLAYAGFGVLSTLVGVAAGHLVAAVTEPSSSPVIAVGSTVIDLTPTPLKEWAIRHFGTNDKTILVGSVLLGVIVLAAVAGLLARRRFAYGAGLLLALVAIPALAALSRPGASVSDLLPSIAAAITGLASFWWLDRTARTPRNSDDRHVRGPEPPRGAGRRRLARLSPRPPWVAPAAGSRPTGPVPRASTCPPPPTRRPPLPKGLEDRVPGISSFRRRPGTSTASTPGSRCRSSTSTPGP